MSCLKVDLFEINKIYMFLHVLYGEIVLRQDKSRLFLVRRYSYKATLFEGLLYAAEGRHTMPALFVAYNKGSDKKP